MNQLPLPGTRDAAAIRAYGTKLIALADAIEAVRASDLPAGKGKSKSNSAVVPPTRGPTAGSRPAGSRTKQVRRRRKSEVRDRIVAAIRANPGAEIEQVAAELGCSVSHARAVRRSLDSATGDGDGEPAEKAQPPPTAAARRIRPWRPVSRPRRKKPLDPNRVLKRKPKPLANPIYNLPAGLIDEIQQLDLGKRKNVKLAHALADQLAAVDEEVAEEIEKIHRLIEELAERIAPTGKPVADELHTLAEEWESRKLEVQAGWTPNHEYKANNFPVDPMVFEQMPGTLLNCRAKEVFEW